ncbi:MAG: ParB/RepB/Spo0J family partition protein [Betaproteobacteria bacterium]|nr:ParB/RepB/Spo0J family partition protein [Betaproteobacteria bacterium]
MAMAKMKGLGRGLDALLGGDEPAAATAVADRQSELKIDQLQPGKYQPRSYMDDAALKELAASIKAQGIMQPILVRPVPGGKFEIIAGERRWRASRIAGLESVPVLVREVPDNAALAMALIENIQREDLNPLEQATGIQRLVNEFGATHDQAADMVGRSRSAVTNLLRLLTLAEPVRDLLQQGKLDMGHARALLALSGIQQVEAARGVVSRDLSVRDTEKLVGQLLRGVPGKAVRKTTDRDVLRLEEELAQKLGTKVQIKAGNKGRGSLVIQYSSLAQLDTILAKLKH